MKSLFLKFNYEEMTQTKSKIVESFLKAAYLKIFLNYLQLITIADSLTFNWEQTLKNFFVIPKFFSGSFLRVFSFDCLVCKKKKN